MFASCKKGASPAPPPPEKTLTLTANKTQCFADGFDEISFKVVNESGVDVTSSATVTRDNGVRVSTNKTYISTPGTYGYYAYIGSVQSATIFVVASAPPPSPYRQNVYLENIISTNSSSFSISTESEFSNSRRPYCKIADFHVNDSMQTPEGGILLTQYALTNGPFVYMNRRTSLPFGATMTIRVDEETQKRSPLGIALESTITGNILNFRVKVGFSVNCTFPLNVACFLLEDSLIYNQTSPTFPNPPIVGFVHDNVFRKTLFEVRSGDPIPPSAQVNGTVWEKNYSFNLSNFNPNHCEIMVFVQYGSNEYGRSGILNVQGVKAGQNKGFE